MVVRRLSITDIVRVYGQLGRRLGYGWGPEPKTVKTTKKDLKRYKLKMNQK